MVNLFAGVHEVGAQLCTPEHHCFSCNVDEFGSAYQWCLECGHGYKSKRELRWTYIKTFWQTTKANPDTEAGGWWRDQWEKFMKLFTRTKKIFFCPLCIHDF